MRTTDRVDSSSVLKLRSLAEAMLEISEQEGYDRARGLSLAVDTAKEAVAADPDELDSILLLGEALHRSFRFNEEFDIYKDVGRSKDSAAVQARASSRAERSRPSSG